MTATNIKEQDTFTRSNTSSASPPNWGTASNGDTWTFNTGGASYTGQISSNQGTLTGGSALVSMTLGSTSLTNVEVLVRVSESTTSSVLGPTVRGTASYYYCQLNSPNLEIGKRVGGTNTTISTAAKTITASTEYWIRFRVVNNAAGTSCNLYARMWADGGSEPGTWDITVTADTAILTGGVVGLKAKMSGASAVGTYDNFTATDASIIKSVSLRIPVRTQSTKSTVLRTLVQTLKTVSAPMRVRVRTLKTVSTVLRVSVSNALGTRKVVSVPLRTRVRTQTTVSTVLRILVRTPVAEVVQISAASRDGIVSTPSRDGIGMNAYARDGMGLSTKGRDGQGLSTLARDGKDITASR